MAWTGANCVFAVEAFFGKAVIAIQRAFHDYFIIHWNDAVLA